MISQSAKLDYQMGYMVVRQEQTRKIFLKEIRMLILETTAVSITGALLSELVKSKVKVIFCDENRNPSAELLPYYGSHDTSAKVRSQAAWSAGLKTAVWTEIVSEKIRKQRELLLRLGKQEEAVLLQSYVGEMEPGDATNREGHAAKVYFNALFGKEFTRAADTNINAALNYGYSILLSAFTREIAANGYITQLGLFHDNMFNPFNLASDLMEPFRPIVDQAVHSMQPELFGKEQKMELVTVLNRCVTVNGRSEFVSNAIKIYCKSVFDALEEQDLSRLRFYRNELSVYENTCDV